VDDRSLQFSVYRADHRRMRRAQPIILSLLMLLAVPVAAAADKAEKAGKETQASLGSVDAARAVGVTDTRVMLQAAVVPGDAGSTATFEYGPTTDYGFSAAANPAQLPRNGAMASASIDGLKSSTTYYFRAVLGTGDGALVGAPAMFTTAPATAKGQANGDGHNAKDGEGFNGGKGERGKGRGGSDEVIAPVQAPKAPMLGESVAVGPRAGTVRVRSADGKAFALTAGANVPAGSVIDATNGTVALTSALDEEGTVQTAEFSGGRFQVRQSSNGDGMVDIYLKGSIGRCRADANTARLASASSRQRPVRRLWGRDRNGKFRTHGNDSVASVRGTHWLTEDTCAGTRTRVTEGSVAVRDLNRKRTVVVRAGHSYLARHSG
jgi:hypothetical protein